MHTLIHLQKKIFPDLLQEMKQRYTVLRIIRQLQPVGRRILAEQAQLTERLTRSEVTILQDQGLITVTTKGMYVTEEGEVVLEELSTFIQSLIGLDEKEKQLKDILQMKRVIIVPGNSDDSEWVKLELGKACVSYLKSRMKRSSVIAVTGGTTIAAVAQKMVPLLDDEDNDYLFVPARGGIDERVENQANTIVAKMAQKANGDYRLLYVPDPLSEATYQSMINEPSIQETLRLIRSSNFILHGIGDALLMAERRKSDRTLIEKLKETGATSEAFGYYFNEDGQVVHKVRTIGIQLEDVENASYVIAVAGGVSKAKAIISYFKQGKSDLLITDEAAADEIIAIMHDKK